MPTDRPRELATVSFAAEQNHDRLSDEFAQAGASATQPRIEDWLERVPEDERPVLFYLLARKEMEARKDDSIADEFRERFPSFSSHVEAIFRDGTDFEVTFEQSTFPQIPGC